LGLTWRPSLDSGKLRTLFGVEGDTVLFASYAMSYERLYMSSSGRPLAAHPGVALTPTRDTTQPGQNALDNDGLGLPVLLRQTGRLRPRGVPGPPAYPSAAARPHHAR